MELGIITALITGACTIIAAIIAGIVAIYQIKVNKNKEKENNIISEKYKKNKGYIDIPIPEHPTLLNPDEYDIEDENYFVTLGGLFQQSRNPKDVTIKKLNREE